MLGPDELSTLESELTQSESLPLATAYVYEPQASRASMSWCANAGDRVPGMAAVMGDQTPCDATSQPFTPLPVNRMIALLPFSGPTAGFAIVCQVSIESDVSMTATHVWPLHGYPPTANPCLPSLTKLTDQAWNPCGTGVVAVGLVVGAAVDGLRTVSRPQG